MEIDPWAFCRAYLSHEIKSDGAVGVLGSGGKVFSVPTLHFLRLNDSACRLVWLECRVQGWFGSPVWSKSQSRVEKSIVGEHCLRIEGKAQLDLSCQLCQGRFLFDLEFERTLVLKRTEKQADAIDNGEYPEDVDAIVCSGALNLQDIVEDEILLSVPMYPRHVQCPSDVLGGSGSHKPFAGLVGLLSE